MSEHNEQPRFDVRCIRDNYYPAGPATITVGKVYSVTSHGTFYMVDNDFGHSTLLDKSRFELVAS